MQDIGAATGIAPVEDLVVDALHLAPALARHAGDREQAVGLEADAGAVAKFVLERIVVLAESVVQQQVHRVRSAIAQDPLRELERIATDAAPPRPRGLAGLQIDRDLHVADRYAMIA